MTVSTAPLPSGVITVRDEGSGTAQEVVLENVVPDKGGSSTAFSDDLAAYCSTGADRLLRCEFGNLAQRGKRPHG